MIYKDFNKFSLYLKRNRLTMVNIIFKKAKIDEFPVILKFN